MSKGPFQEVHNGLCRAPRQERNDIFREGLALAAEDVPELERLRRQVAPNQLGIIGMQELAHILCRWAEREGILDQIMPRRKEGGSDERA